MILALGQVLLPEQAASLRSCLERGHWQDGALTAGNLARRVKRNLQLDDSAHPAGEPSWAEWTLRIVRALVGHQGFVDLFLPNTLAGAVFNKYEPAMEYGYHIDNAIMRDGRCDVAVTVFLSNHPHHYEGGGLRIGEPMQRDRIYLSDPERQMPINLPAGHAIAFDASLVHRVEEVTSGVRYACVLWFQSYVKEPARRQILADLTEAQRGVTATLPDRPEELLLSKSRANLLRMWAKP